MKSTMIKRIAGIFTAVVMIGIGSIGMSAQNSLPAPGSGGGFNPAPAGGPGPGGPGPAGPAPGGPGFGGPGFGGPGPGPVAPPPPSGPSFGININLGVSPVNANQGTARVIAAGYDNMGNYRVIPMTVAYTYTYGEYNVTVLSAYNPFTQTWMRGIDMPAYNTSYFLRGNTYNFYAPLSTGTYYFNL